MALRKDDVANFKTLLQAAKAGDVALMEVERRSDGAVVAAIVAVGREGDDYTMTPFAVMVEGNPFELFNPPAVDGGFEKAE